MEIGAIDSVMGGIIDFPVEVSPVAPARLQTQPAEIRPSQSLPRDEIQISEGARIAFSHHQATAGGDLS